MRLHFFEASAPAGFILLCIVAVLFSQGGSGIIGMAEVARAQSVPRTGLFKVATTQLYVEPGAQDRPLNLSVWYPTASRTEEILFASSTSFEGFRAMHKGELEPGRFPLLVISHGLGGNMYNQAWLAVALAERGFIVAAPNHPGTMTGDMASAQTSRLWERPRDISRVISLLLSDPFFAPHIAVERIAVAGHSMGGYTALSLAGALFDPERFAADCARHSTFADCRWYAANKPGAAPDSAADDSLLKLKESWLDARVRALVLLEPSFVRGFTPDSLGGIKVPVLLIGAGSSDAMDAVSPVSLLAGYLAEQLPQSGLTYEQIIDAGHFSFLPNCLPRGRELVQRAGAGAENFCTDGGKENGRGRALIHAEIIQQILAFLDDKAFGAR